MEEVGDQSCDLGFAFAAVSPRWLSQKSSLGCVFQTRVRPPVVYESKPRLRIVLVDESPSTAFANKADDIAFLGGIRFSLRFCIWTLRHCSTEKVHQLQYGFLTTSRWTLKFRGLSNDITTLVGCSLPQTVFTKSGVYAVSFVFKL